MNGKKDKLGGIAACLIEILVGVLLFLNPEGFTSGIIIALGAILLVSGLINIVRYFRLNPLQAAAEQGMAKGLIGGVFGSFCIVCHEWFVYTFPILTVLYGIGMLVAGLFKAQYTIDALRLGKRWGWAAVTTVLTILFSAAILINPFGSTRLLWQFTALALILEAVLDLVSLLFLAKAEKSRETPDA